MEAENNKQYELWQFIGVPIFRKKGKLYSFSLSEGLKAYPAENYQKDGWVSFSFFKEVAGETSKELINELLSGLKEGDSANEFIVKFQYLQNMKWKPRRMKEIPNNRQLALIEKPLVNRKGYWYGFDYRGEFVCLCKSKTTPDEVQINEPLLFLLSDRWPTNIGNIEKALIRLRVGESLKDFSNHLVRIKEEKSREFKEAHPEDRLDRFITRISLPKYERETDNHQVGTFDFIRVEVGIITYWHENRLEYIKKHKKEISQMVVERIEKSKTFQKKGIPINFLKLSHIMLTNDSILEYLFELKIK